MKHLNAWVGAYGGIERPISTEVGSSFGYAKVCSRTKGKM